METPTVLVKSEHPSQGEYVVINAKDFDPAKHEKYVLPLPGAPAAVVPPPSAPPADPLAALPKNWRDKAVGEMRALAEAVTGRTPDDHTQAIAMIAAALAAREAPAPAPEVVAPVAPTPEAPPAVVAPPPVEAAPAPVVAPPPAA